MTTLRHIGNSQGILIPKALIQQANLEGHELVFELHPQGLLIKPIDTPRVTWAADIERAMKHQVEPLDAEWLDGDLVEDEPDEW